MTPLFFGPKEHPLFGVLHMPDGPASTKAVLLCSPFGQEAIRTHRLYRVLADRLCRLGIPTLRFDYFGTGDSGGDDIEVDLHVWASDIQLADQELRRQSGLNSIVWMGARLGGTAAWQAAQPAPPSQLVLWDPVVDGKNYLNTLQEEHTARLKRVFRRTDSPWLSWPREVFPGVAAEAGGFPVPVALHTQLSGLSSLSLNNTLQNCTTLIGDIPSNQWQAKSFAELQKIVHKTVDLPASFSWAEHEVRDGKIVPAPALQCLIKTLGS